ncbi:MAG: 50S ribosomal protein L24 [Chloroflexi bacterium RBG_13_54_9]|nr:MAG: 50S ribosomal protein L24 [Chloroflexi bacterium RBG_13_54_9]
MKIRREDNVLVIAGKDRGKKGKVHRIFPKENRVLVEGVNVVKRHTKPRGTVRQAGIVEREAPIHLSNVMLICTRCDRPTRVGFRLLEGGGKVRICRSCHEQID